MMGDILLLEMEAACAAVRQKHLDRLWGLGVPKAFIADLGSQIAPVGVAPVEAAGGGLYQPSTDGVPHLIIPAVEDGVLVDLVAFRSGDPGSWLLRTGAATALGIDNGVGSFIGRGPVHLYSDPLDWMRGSGAGVCVLDWDSPELRQFDVLDAVTCTSPVTADLFRHAMARPARVPTISTMEAAHVA